MVTMAHLETVVVAFHPAGLYIGNWERFTPSAMREKRPRTFSNSELLAKVHSFASLTLKKRAKVRRGNDPYVLMLFLLQGDIRVKFEYQDEKR